MCLLSKIIISLSASNSTVERAFNILSLLLSDQRLSMEHSTIEKLLLLNVNDKNWCDVERAEMIEQVVEMYLKKRRTTNVQTTGPPGKRLRLNSTSGESETDSEGTSSGNERN